MHSISNNMDLIAVFGILLAILILLILAIVTLVCSINKKYAEFVYEHSLAIRKLKEINKKYTFYNIKSFDQKSTYDNENFYNNISPQDYLIYQLASISSAVSATLRQTNKNRENLAMYKHDLNGIRDLNEYDTVDLPFFKEHLANIEIREFKNLIYNPTTHLEIKVLLILTKINGEVVRRKAYTFNEDQIKKLVSRVSNQTGGFYNDYEIWEAICRVERGRVSNKMRFSIYARDRHRCVKCGSTRNLEIDHIFPIAKGGKSVYSNLQTLCSRCNARKSDSVEPGSVRPGAHRRLDRLCPYCESELVVRNGRNGPFLGCSAFPECRYTRDLD